jgi:hypothetical protein
MRVIKSRRMRWVDHIARIGEWRGVYRVLVEEPKEKRPLGDQSVDSKIILRWIFGNWDVGVWTGLGWLRIETDGGQLRTW